MGRRDTAGFHLIETWARSLKLSSLHDLIACLQTSPPGWLDRIRVMDAGAGNSGIAEILEWLLTTQVETIKLMDVTGWSWIDGWKVENGWRRSAREWTKMQEEKMLSSKGLSRKWDSQIEPELWRWRWCSLWGGRSLQKHKAWLWRVLHQGFPTNSRMARWGKSDGMCEACGREAETIEHVIWGCSHLRTQVEWMAEVILGPGFGRPSFLQVLDKALQVHRSLPVVLILLYEHCYNSWLARNKWVFECQVQRLPPSQILDKAVHTILHVLEELSTVESENEFTGNTSQSKSSMYSQTSSDSCSSDSADSSDTLMADT
ncbi:hypothetical protein R1sor_019895 [Riccia sorocarpa]|uniref:Reverse transcriptase zinc-binding domain-containing protein n=1 Tax=Riccia sorocarpa TaxID=122646 RepID=A0ABD3IDT0_9MARC